MFWKKKAMLLVLVLVFAGSSAHAELIFGEPVNLGPTVNTSSDDGTPAISADGLELYFSSRRPGGSGSWDIWVMTRTTINDEWGKPTNLGLNSSFFDACPCPSADGLSLYFASGRSGGYGGYCDIWVTRRAAKSESWGEPVNLGATVNSSADEAFPVLSPDNLQLYFCEFFNFRPGGFGDSDLWMTKRPTVSDAWGLPVNLGPTINSSANEQSASISADGRVLFFNPDRSGGHGNSDIWLARWSTVHDDWGTPVNLGPVVNSSFRDEAPSISADGRTLYFHTNRSGGYGELDLWQLSIDPVVDFDGNRHVDCTDICDLVAHWGTDDSLYDIGPMPWGDGIVDEKD
ncbi:TolB family protein, partial [Planctomycetota bacterium]